jgi:tRNA(Met) C34 N-acetyltransferase TmcA
MSYEFRNMEINLCSGILDPSSFTSEIAASNNNNPLNDFEIEAEQGNEEDNLNNNLKFILTPSVLEYFIDLYDLKRIQAYTNNISDYHLIMDLIPILSKLFFEGKFKNMRMSYSQCSILIGLGL